jgi:hypothetical protein
MQNELQQLVNTIKADYVNWCTQNGTKELTGYFAETVATFDEKVEIKEGKKYIKIFTKDTLWGFIMKNDDAKFKKGDILKAASFNSPARNQARGNIFEKYSVAWTGPHYLK